MAKLKFNSPVLFVKDLDAMKSFYVNVLSQKVESDFGACIILKSGISLWDIPENHTITEYNGKKWFQEGNKNLELCFETDDFETILQNLNNYNLDLVHDAMEENWGQYTIRFKDPEGNLIEVGESIPCFVKRLYNEGLAISDIVKKTSVKKELVEDYIKA